MSDEMFKDPVVFIEGLREFVYRKLSECEQIVAVLIDHPECPEPQPNPPPPRSLSDEDIIKTIEVLNSLIDDEGDEASLLPEASKGKSSRLLRPGKNTRKSTSPSPTRRKVAAYFAKEYEKLRKLGTRWIKAHSSVSPHKKSPSPKPQSQTKKVITEILVEIEKIQSDLAFLDGFIRVCEESVKCPDNDQKGPPMKIMDSLKNSIFLEYRTCVERPIKDNKEVRKFVELRTDKIFKDSPEKATGEGPQVQSPSKKLKGQASPKASKYSNEAGPSTVFGGGSTGTPKRTGPKSESPQEKRKKASSKAEDESGSVGGKVKETADRASSLEESDQESRDTISSKFNESVQDLDLSETEDSKDKMEQS